jgi:hypothetical protein
MTDLKTCLEMVLLHSKRIGTGRKPESQQVEAAMVKYWSEKAKEALNGR